VIIEVPPKTDPFFVKMKEGALPATDGHEALKADGIIGTTPMQNGVDGRRVCVLCV
jgi:hypothetical protein